MDDPSSDPSLSETEADAERERLFKIIRELVKWENSNNEEVLERARAENAVVVAEMTPFFDKSR